MLAGLIRLVPGFAAIALLAGSACGGKRTEEVVKIDGSSTVYPITEAIAEELGKVAPEIRLTVGVSGTGGGFKRYCSGDTDISNASRPIKPSEVELCAKNQVEWIELPIAFDGIVIVVNPKNDWAHDITVAELKRLWEPAAQKTITRWNQVRASWPDRAINLYGAGTDSGTFDYFTEAICGKEKSSRGDYTASEDDNVLVQGIASNELALGYFGFAYWRENQGKLRALPVDDEKPDNGAGLIVASPQTIADGTYQPLSRPLFIYVSKRSLERPGVSRLVSFYLAEAARLVPEVGYVPLPPTAYTLAQARADKRVTGSLFGGHGSQVGVSIEQLLAREADSP